MAFIHSIKTSVPKYTVSQLEFYEAVSPRTPERFHKIFKKILDGSQIRKRHFSAPLDEMIDMTEKKRVADKFALWKEASMEHYTSIGEQLLLESGLKGNEIDMICTCTTSGFITPDPTVLLIDKLNLKRNIKRYPIFGYGCSGGAASINRVKEYLDGHPTEAALVFVGETLSNQYENIDSVSVIVANSIFGDGFAGLLMVGKDHRLAEESQVELYNAESHVFPDCNFAVGQWMEDDGVHTHVDAKLPSILEQGLRGPMDTMFESMNTSISDVDYWVCHAGGPKVVNTFKELMGLDDKDVESTLETYRDFGNQSSVSVLTSLERTLNKVDKEGIGYIMGLGPGIHLAYALCKIYPKKQDKIDLSGFDNVSNITTEEVSSVEIV